MDKDDIKKELHIITLKIGERIRTQRILKGHIQATAADTLGVTCQQFQKYETGLNRISCASLFALAEAWDVPIGTFFPKDGGIADHLDVEAVKHDLALLGQFGKLNAHTKLTLKTLMQDLLGDERAQSDAGRVRC